MGTGRSSEIGEVRPKNIRFLLPTVDWLTFNDYVDHSLSPVNLNPTFLAWNDQYVIHVSGKFCISMDKWVNIFDGFWYTKSQILYFLEM